MAGLETCRNVRNSSIFLENSNCTFGSYLQVGDFYLKIPAKMIATDKQFLKGDGDLSGNRH